MNYACIKDVACSTLIQDITISTNVICRSTSYHLHILQNRICITHCSRELLLRYLSVKFLIVYNKLISSSLLPDINMIRLISSKNTYSKSYIGSCAYSITHQTPTKDSNGLLSLCGDGYLLSEPPLLIGASAGNDFLSLFNMRPHKFSATNSK